MWMDKSGTFNAKTFFSFNDIVSAVNIVPDVEKKKEKKRKIFLKKVN